MSISDSFADWHAHRTVRADAERRRSLAQREFHQHQRQAKRDLHTIRRQGETAAIVARSRLVAATDVVTSVLAGALSLDPPMVFLWSAAGHGLAGKRVLSGRGLMS